MRCRTVWRHVAAVVAAVSLVLGTTAAGSATIAAAAVSSSLPCSGQHLSWCPLRGLYAPNPDPVIFNDTASRYRIVWVGSYVWAPPRGEVPQWISVYVYYENYGNQTLTFVCPPTVPDPGSIKEWFYRDGKNIGYVPASTDYCSNHPELHQILRPGGIFESTAKFHNVPWRGDKIALEWPQTQDPTATSAFTNLYQVYHWATASKNPPRGRHRLRLADVEDLAGMIWQVVGLSNTVCEILQCKFIPPDVTKLISKIGQVQTIGDLANAVREAITLGNDLSALNNAIKGHTRGAPYSAKAKRLAKKSWNDARVLQKTLEDLVPFLSAVWPVPAPK